MTAADAIATLLEDEWETSIPGRETPIPDVVADEESGTGVLIDTNFESVRRQTNTHDIVHVQHVASQVTERGSKSEQIVDEVQIDIRISDRDIDADGVREAVYPRMFGERDPANESDTLGGLAGEVKRILNGIRKGFKEWDTAPHSREIQYIRNTDARVTFTVELTIIERDVQQPL